MSSTKVSNFPLIHGKHSRPINDAEGIFDGSYLNIVWFGDDFKNNTIDKMIMNLKNFDCQKEAQSYEF